MAIDIHKLLRSNKASILSLDQGLTYGPSIFNTYSIDPEHVLKIALECEMTGVVLTPGLAEKYYHGEYRDVPLIVKVNGTSCLGALNPDAKQFCSVERAVKLGADAIGFTVYDGSPSEAEMLAEFGKVIEEAHEYGIPVVAWMYPRGQNVHEANTDTIAYAARIALELGADFVTVKHPHDMAGMPWIVKSAGRAKVLGADVDGHDIHQMLEYTKQLMESGATGICFGKSVWQSPNPFGLMRALHGIVYESRSVEDVQKHLQ